MLPNDFSTRPEALTLKLAPVILELGRHPDCFENLVCVTGQHREMLDQVPDWLQIQPDYGFNLMRPNQRRAAHLKMGTEQNGSWISCSKDRHERTVS